MKKEELNWHIDKTRMLHVEKKGLIIACIKEVTETKTKCEFCLWETDGKTMNFKNKEDIEDFIRDAEINLRDSAQEYKNQMNFTFNNEDIISIYKIPKTLFMSLCDKFEVARKYTFK